jgi:GT2 family glycosyltransferase
MNSAEVVVIILNWNDAARTLRAASAVREWRRVRAELRVVDNGSSEEDVARLKAELDADCLLSSPANLGFSGGHNLAFGSLRRGAETGGDVPVLLLNSDARLAEDDLRELLDVLCAHPEAAAVGPLLYEVGAGATHLCAGGNDIARHLNAHRIVAAAGAPDAPDAAARVQTADYVPGTIALLNPRALRAVGAFDERYFFSGEVADWCARARRLGYSAVIATRAVGHHDLGQPHALRGTLYFYYSLRNRLLFTRKFSSRRRLYFWYACYLKLAIGRLWRGQPASARAALLALWHGLRGKFGDQNHYFVRGR